MNKLLSIGIACATVFAAFGCVESNEPIDHPSNSAVSETSAAAPVTSRTAAAEPTTAVNNDDGWSSLSGQIIVSGAPQSEDEVLGDSPDKALCMIDGKPPKDDNIVVSDAGGLRDVYVMMYLDRGDDEPTIHPSYDEAKKQSLTIDNLKCRFVPHALFVRPGQKLTLKNSDPVGHNCHITTFNNEENINLPPNSTIEIVLKEEDKVPGEVKCDVHKWMDGVIMVRNNPYVAISDADGKFEIKNLPAGTWKFQFWHKKIGFLKTLEIPGKELGRRGETDFEFKKDETLDLGKLNLPWPDSN